jgi:zinc protease
MFFIRKKKSITVCVVLLLFSFLFIACNSDAKKYGALGLANDEVPLMGGLRKGTLPSGLAYYILPNKKPENRAFLTLIVNAGSVLESDDQRGIAHFVEHMAFEGTERFPANELDAYLQSLGMILGPDYNASTSYDWTKYDIVVPTEINGQGQKTIPQKAMQVIDDWSHAVLFDSKEVDGERPIILEEYRMRLGVNRRSRDALFPVLFAGSQYDGRFPIGVPEVIESAPPELLKSYYDRWYRADNMAVIFSGDFDADTLEASLGEYFTIHSPTTPLDMPVYDLPPPVKNHIDTIIFTDPEQSYTNISLVYKQKYRPEKNNLENFREDIIDDLIDEIITERFEEVELNAATPFFGAGAGNVRYVRRSSHYYIGAAVKNGLTAETLKALLEQKESIVRYGFLESEIDRAKANYISALEKNAAEKEKFESTSYIPGFVNNFLNDGGIPDFEWQVNAAKILLPLISAKDMHTTAKNYFAGDDVVVFLAANEAVADSLPGEDEIANIIHAGKTMKIKKPKEALVQSKLIKEAPEKGGIVLEQRDEDAGALIWELSNGAKVILKETQNKNDEILLYSLARGGKTDVPVEDIPSVSLAGEVANSSGLGEWKLPDLTKMLAGKQVSISFNISSWTRSVNGSSTKADLPTFFELLYLEFTSPRLDEDQAAIIQEQYRSLLAQRLDNPDNYFSDEITKIIYNNNPYFMTLEEKDLDAFNIDTAREFIVRGLNPADWTFVFTGNIEIDAIRPLVETYIASIPRGDVFNTFANLSIDYPQTVERTIYKGKENKSSVYLAHIGKRPYSFKDNMTADVLTEYLNIILTDVIRQRNSLVYNISSGVTFSALPPGGMFESVVYFICDPKNVDELTVMAEAEFAKIASGRINTVMFNNAKESILKSTETSLENNGYIGSRFVNYPVIFDMPPAMLYQKSGFYNKVSPDDISVLARDLLNRGLVRIVMFPEGEN